MNLSIENKTPSSEELEKLLEDFISSQNDEESGAENQPFCEESCGSKEDTEDSFNRVASRTPLSAFDELMSMTGLEEVKEMVSKQLSYHRIMDKRRSIGRRTPPRILHLLLTGNPGCGKTTVARLIGQIFKDAGLLSCGQFVETNRAQLVGKYIGESEANTSEKIREATGGVLFIDEIYSLVESAEGGKDFGMKVIDTLMPVLSDAGRDIMVIGAGYPENMKEFLSSNPGLASRFPHVLNLKDFTEEQLLEIALNHIAGYDFCLSAEAEMEMRRLIRCGKGCRNSGNARMVITMIDNHIIPNLCSRLDRESGNGKELPEEALSLILPEDLPDLRELFPLVSGKPRVGFSGS